METKKDILAKLKNHKYLSLIPSFKEARMQAFYTLTLSLIAVAICIYFAINPTISTITQLSKELEDNKLIEQKLIEKITNLQTLQQKYNAIQQDLPTLYAALPETPKVPPFQGQLLAITRKANTTISQLQTSKVELLTQNTGAPKTQPTTQPTQPAESVPLPGVAGPGRIVAPQTNISVIPPSFEFSLASEGSYNNITDFLTTLVDFERLTTIDSLSIKAGTSKTDAWKITVSGKAYYYVDAVTKKANTNIQAKPIQ